MENVDKGKLKVLIKMILLERSPKRLTANQIQNIINKHDWGFRTSITTPMVGKLLSYELKKNNNNFLDCIQSSKKKGGNNVYYIASVNEK